MSNLKKRFRFGCVQASIWANERSGGSGTFVVDSVRFSRRYKKKDGKWTSSVSFRKNDIPKLRLVCDKVYEFLNTREVEKNPETASGTEGN